MSSTGTKAPLRWRKVTSSLAQSQTGWKQKAFLRFLEHSPVTNQSEEGYTLCSPINTSSLKSTRSSEDESLILLIYWTQSKPFSDPNSNISVCLASCASGTWTWVRQHPLRLINHRTFKIDFSKVELDQILQQNPLLPVVSKSKGIDRELAFPLEQVLINSVSLNAVSNYSSVFVFLLEHGHSHSSMFCCGCIWATMLWWIFETQTNYLAL